MARTTPNPAQRQIQSLGSKSALGCELADAEHALRIAIEQRGLDPKGLIVSPLTTIADYFIIASGTSERHVKGIADNIERGLKKRGISPLSVGGYDNGEWVLLDYGDMVVHLFYEPLRHYYNLDELWTAAESIPVPADIEAEAKKLRTGMY